MIRPAPALLAALLALAPAARAAPLPPSLLPQAPALHDAADALDAGSGGDAGTQVLVGLGAHFGASLVASMLEGLVLAKLAPSTALLWNPGKLASNALYGVSWRSQAPPLAPATTLGVGGSVFIGYVDRGAKGMLLAGLPVALASSAVLSLVWGAVEPGSSKMWAELAILGGVSFLGRTLLSMLFYFPTPIFAAAHVLMPILQYVVDAGILLYLDKGGGGDVGPAHPPMDAAPPFEAVAGARNDLAPAFTQPLAALPW